MHINDYNAGDVRSDRLVDPGEYIAGDVRSDRLVDPGENIVYSYIQHIGIHCSLKAKVWVVKWSNVVVLLVVSLNSSSVLDRSIYWTQQTVVSVMYKLNNAISSSLTTFDHFSQTLYNIAEIQNFLHYIFKSKTRFTTILENKYCHKQYSKIYYLYCVFINPKCFLES